MEELQVLDFEKTDITTWDFEEIKAELGRVLSGYETTVYTDDTIKNAKKDKATLAKAKKAVEDQRKAFKAKCLAPYEELEPKVKELVNMIETQRVAIDDIVKDYTERQKQEKQAEVKKYYDSKAFELSDLAEPLFLKLLDPKWLNATTSKAEYAEGVQSAIAKAKAELDEIRAMNSPFEKTLIEKYVETVSLDSVKAKQEELNAAIKLSGLSEEKKQDETLVTNQQPQGTLPVDGSTTIRIRATQSKVNQVLDFMKAIGVEYEVL